MATANIIVFDLETGGFLTKDHTYGIAEIGAIAINSETGEELGRYEAIIAPYKTFDGSMTQYTEQALNINGLTMNQINNGKDARVVAKEFIAFANAMKVKGRVGLPILAGHNINDFDIPYLEQFFELLSIDASKNFSSSTFDSLMWSRLKFMGSLTSNGLSDSCNACGIELVDAHRAMADVEANVQLVKHYLDLLRGIGGSGQIQSQSIVRPRVDFKF